MGQGRKPSRGKGGGREGGASLGNRAVLMFSTLLLRDGDVMLLPRPGDPASWQPLAMPLSLLRLLTSAAGDEAGLQEGWCCWLF